ncbi:MAG: LysM peptidoglycan-binding domain-containing protein [Chloroflexi bacterium]|nr:LysM peptidoglycan-binding domain-containing protein [Chloroflexota bacterium]
MKISRFILIMSVLIGLTLAVTPRAAAASPGFVVVRWGDTLAAIAARSGTSLAALMRANAIPNANIVYAGQKLVIPAGSFSPAPANPAPTGSVYTVVGGDTLGTIAARHGTTISSLMQANGLTNQNFIYTGQRLNVPGRNAPASATQPAPAPAPAPLPIVGASPAPPTTGKWIDVNISKQTITAYQGSAPLKAVLVSTGVAWHPTPAGRFAVYTKIKSQTMSGGYGADSYYLPGVPWVMYFTGAYAIHGTYWHRNFGQPMSHGCVNLTIDDAKWFFDWAEIGTPVMSHL